MKSAINWFEIPSTDFDRAVKFYSDILGEPLRKVDSGGTPNGVFPYESNDQDRAVGGSVIYDKDVKPGAGGTKIYLNCTGILDDVLARVPAAGGQVLSPKVDTPFGQPGVHSGHGRQQGWVARVLSLRTESHESQIRDS